MARLRSNWIALLYVGAVVCFCASCGGTLGDRRHDRTQDAGVSGRATGGAAAASGGAAPGGESGKGGARGPSASGGSPIRESGGTSSGGASSGGASGATSSGGRRMTSGGSAGVANGGKGGAPANGGASSGGSGGTMATGGQTAGGTSGRGGGGGACSATECEYCDGKYTRRVSLSGSFCGGGDNPAVWEVRGPPFAFEPFRVPACREAPTNNPRYCCTADFVPICPQSG